MNLLLAAFIALGVTTVAARGSSPLPPLGPVLDPGTGVWTSAADAELPRAETMHLAGMRGGGSVTFEGSGAAHVVAASDHDLFLITGYLHARFRLFQMDLERRQGEGLLSQVVGNAALPSDRFELKLGLVRTASAELATMSGSARNALEAYAQGVNDRIAEDRKNHTLPFLFHMLAYTPTPWRPVDTLVVQGDITQTLDFTDSPLDYAVLTRTLGYARTMAWFPVLPPDQQHPYTRGPYRRVAPVPLPAQLAGAGVAAAATSLHAQLAALGVLHGAGNSNNWAVSGAKTASGKPLMAGDPHLHQTLPAIWYQLSQDSPDYHVVGVSIPGTPVVLIGRNRHISWSLTNTQNQATLYYVEKTDSAHPHQYFWRGSWHAMKRISYAIPVKGVRPDPLTVDLTAHGPIVTDDRLPGKKIAVYWVGALPSQNLDVLLRIGRSSTFAQFRNALHGWHAPSQNFIYADDAGNIGLVSAGYYPLVGRGAPWLPLPGTGESDVTGTIPFDAIPQAYNPPSHILFTANQRPVGPTYPYYIGTTLDFFDNGYRADRIAAVLSAKRGLTVRDMERLQLDTHDYLAMRILPSLLRAIPAGGSRDAVESRALLAGWDGSMDATSAAASIWWTFWSRYLHDTFDPWWRAYHVPSGKYGSLKVGPYQPPLDEDLESWTLRDASNPVFSPPGGTRRTAAQVMRQAFAEAVTKLRNQLGAGVSSWRWERLHTREFTSLAQIPGLGYGPRGSGSDLWTVNAAGGGQFQSDSGPSWRMIVDWGSGSVEGVYPGGQSENPASSWYKTEIDAWWSGRYFPLHDAAQARRLPGSVTWTVLR